MKLKSILAASLGAGISGFMKIPGGDAGWIWLGAGLALGVGGAAYIWRRMHPGYALRNRVVVIAGGSRGLGFAIATECLRQGARVALAGHDAERLAQAEARLSRLGQVRVHACDLRDPQSAAALIAGVHAAWGAVDVLINNAGVMMVGPWQAMTEADFAEAMAVHFWSPLWLTQAVLPQMIARGEGRIVNIVSIGGVVPMPRMLPYTASKFALAGLSDAWAAELRGTGVRVTSVFPWLMRTGSQTGARFKGDAPAEFAWFALGALPGVSQSARGAARGIVRAMRRGQSRLVLTLPANAAALARGIAPGMVNRGLAVMHALLPQDAGADQAPRSGADSFNAWTRRWLQPAIARAQAELNQSASSDARNEAEPMTSAADTKTG